MWRFILSFILLAGLNPILCAQDQALPPPPPASPTTGSSSAGRGEVEKGGLIQGKVIGADTAAGLRKTTLILRRLESQTEDKPVTTHTDQNGYYRFTTSSRGDTRLQRLVMAMFARSMGKRGLIPSHPQPESPWMSRLVRLCNPSTSGSFAGELWRAGFSTRITNL